MNTNSSSSSFSRRSCAVPVGFAYVYFAWGFTYLGTKFAIVDLPVLLMSGTRFFLAGLFVLLGVAFFDRPDFRRGNLREWSDAARIGILLLVLGIGTGNWTQQYVSSSFCAMVFSALPLWIVLIDWVRPGGRAPARMAAAGLLLGFAGVAVILAPQAGAKTGPAHIGADILLVLASISWAAGAVFSRDLTARGSALLPVARQMIVAGAVLLLTGALHGDFARLNLPAVHPSAWLGFAYLLLIGSTTGYPVYIWLMRTCPSSKVATIPYVNLLMAVLGGWTLGHEVITTRLLTGTGIVVASVAVVLRAKERSSAREPLPLTEEQLPAPGLRADACPAERRS